MTNLQPEMPDVPVQGATPQPYISASSAMERLTSYWGLTSTLAEGHLLVASIHADQEGPFFGVKVNVEQERAWPRTFMYGWPNIIAAPTPVLVSEQFPGAFYLNYEGVVPQQIVDWVCLEAFRLTNLPLLQSISSEGVTGASVHFALGEPAELDRMMHALISPFRLRQGRTQAFLNFAGSGS